MRLATMWYACADPGIFVRGGPGQTDKKSSDNVVFFLFFFVFFFHFSPQLILQKSNGQFQINLLFFKVPARGGPTFSGGLGVSGGGGGGGGRGRVQLLIPYRNPRGGGGGGGGGGPIAYTL